jgi:hypothetical protein
MTISLVGLILVHREIPFVQMHQPSPPKASLVRQILNPSDLHSAFALNGEILVRTFALASTAPIPAPSASAAIFGMNRGQDLYSDQFIVGGYLC